MLFKSCQRCGGDLFEEEFAGQMELVCLQCGYRQTVASQLGILRFPLARQAARGADRE